MTGSKPMDQASTDEPLDGFQTGAEAWNPLRPDLQTLLQRSRHLEIRPVYYGSNHVFLVRVEAADAGSSYAIYKPARGEYPLYDFPSGTLYRREVATYHIDRILGRSVVPVTVETRGRYGPGSLQIFIESYDQGEIAVGELRRLALLDIIVNNADRKPEHCLLGEGGKLWGIDHGLTFHAHPKLRTILWHFAADPLQAEECRNLERLKSILERCTDVDARRVRELISTSEWKALRDRVARVVNDGRFPDPRYKPVPYRW